jgi:RimJ/RimL family protein N-acetyltransferase
MMTKVAVKTDPVIRKAQRLVGNQLILRNADISDADFILDLRTDAKKRRFISPTSPELLQQIAWLEQYAQSQDQAYFVAEDLQGDKVGTFRIYDPVGDSFCIGSWIMREGVPAPYAVESLVMLYRYALVELGFSRSYFAVRKANRSVWRFMERSSAVRTGETDIDYLYETQRAPLLESFRRYDYLLPNGFQVEN